MSEREELTSEAPDKIHELALKAKRLKEREDFRGELDKVGVLARSRWTPSAKPTKLRNARAPTLDHLFVESKRS